jgi:hypothetical protein
MLETREWGRFGAIVEEWLFCFKPSSSFVSHAEIRERKSFI